MDIILIICSLHLLKDFKIVFITCRVYALNRKIDKFGIHHVKEEELRTGGVKLTRFSDADSVMTFIEKGR